LNVRRDLESVSVDAPNMTTSAFAIGPFFFVAPKEKLFMYLLNVAQLVNSYFVQHPTFV
jgi:hypothetical protein